MRDPVSEVNSLRYELNVSLDKYAKLALSKEASDRRIGELQAELETNRIKHSKVARKLESDSVALQSDYDTGLMRLKVELHIANTEATNLKREYDMQRLHSMASDKRIVELEMQLDISRNDLSAGNVARSQSEKRIAELEAHCHMADDELAVAKKQLVSVSDMKVQMDAIIAGLQEQRKKDAAYVADCDSRIKGYGKGESQITAVA